MTTFTTQTPNILNVPMYQYGWKSNIQVVQASLSYTYSQGGMKVLRSNAGAAMTDTLPPISNSSADSIPSALWNGWFVDIINFDVSDLTVSAATGNTIGGLASVNVAPGATVQFYTDGVTWYTVGATSGGTVITVATGAAINLAQYGNGVKINRSDATSAMTDTLPVATTLPSGWSIFLNNIDSSATDTVTPVTSTINGASTLAVTHGKSTMIYTDGTNYFATTPN